MTEVGVDFYDEAFKDTTTELYYNMNKSDGTNLHEHISEADAKMDDSEIMSDNEKCPIDSSLESEHIESDGWMDHLAKNTWTFSEETLAWTSSKIASYSTVQKLFRCIECGCVGLLSDIAEHWLGTHANIRIYQCSQCSYASAWARCLRMHLARQHNICPEPSTEQSFKKFWKEDPALEDVTKYLERLKSETEIPIKIETEEPTADFEIQYDTNDTSYCDLENENSSSHFDSPSSPTGSPNNSEADLVECTNLEEIDSNDLFTTNSFAENHNGEFSANDILNISDQMNDPDFLTNGNTLNEPTEYTTNDTLNEIVEHNDALDQIAEQISMSEFSNNNLNLIPNLDNCEDMEICSVIIKRYNCEHCAYTTDRRDLFNRHENIHRDDKPYECNVCLKQFNRADHIKKHFLRLHPDQNYCLHNVRRDMVSRRKLFPGNFRNPTINTSSDVPQKQTRIRKPRINIISNLEAVDTFPLCSTEEQRILSKILPLDPQINKQMPVLVPIKPKLPQQDTRQMTKEKQQSSLSNQQSAIKTAQQIVTTATQQQSENENQQINLQKPSQPSALQKIQSSATKVNVPTTQFNLQSTSSFTVIQNPQFTTQSGSVKIKPTSQVFAGQSAVQLMDQSKVKLNMQPIQVKVEPTSLLGIQLSGKGTQSQINLNAQQNSQSVSQFTTQPKQFVVQSIANPATFTTQPKLQFKQSDLQFITTPSPNIQPQVVVKTNSNLNSSSTLPIQISVHLQNLNSSTDSEKPNMQSNVKIDHKMTNSIGNSSTGNIMEPNVESTVKSESESPALNISVKSKRTRNKKDKTPAVKLVEPQDKSYNCSLCKWIGIDKWSLRRHMNTHSKPFECPVCEYKAARSERLQTHVNKVHQKCVCTSCGYTTDDVNQLVSHQQQTHKNVRTKRTRLLKSIPKKS